MAISTEITDNGRQVEIRVKGRFDFNVHREFRDAYRNESPDAKYLINMADADYIDSSALGMLLLLREHGGDNHCDVKIIRCCDEIKKVLTTSNFDALFRIETK